MTNHQQRELTLLIQKIEQQLNWGDSLNWSGEEFEALRQEILTDTEQALSVTTLKRVWGKVKQENSPSKSTLNILAQFAGYKNWNHFRQEQKAKQKPTIVRTVKISNLAIGGILLTVFILFYLLLANSLTTKVLGSDEIDQISFEAKITSLSFPRTATFSYNIGALEAEGFEIWQSKNGDQTIPLSQKNGTIADTYYYPGYFSVQLMKYGIIAKEKPLYFATNGWQALVNKSSLNFPIYLNDDQLVKDSLLSFRKGDFSKYNRDQDYINIWLSKLSDTPSIDGNNFSFISDFRLTQAFNNSPCKVITVILHGTAGKISFGFSIPGCIGDLNFNFLGETISGSTNNLSKFGINPTDWIALKVLHQNHQLKIFVADTLLLEHALGGNIGLVGGVTFVFDGFGEIKKAELSDLTQKKRLF